MKGLLLKDLYMTAKYCRAFLLIVLVFLVVSFFSDENTFFVAYPIMVAGIIPMTLLSYDERDKWDQYSGALPYSKAQLVSSKYLIGLLLGGSVYLLSLVAAVIRMGMRGGLSLEKLLWTGTLLLFLGLLPSALLLPFVFKYGAEKGRIAFYGTIGFLCIGVIVLNGLDLQTALTVGGNWIAAVAVGAAILVYALSWRLSVAFYRKREW